MLVVFRVRNVVKLIESIVQTHIGALNVNMFKFYKASNVNMRTHSTILNY